MNLQRGLMPNAADLLFPTNPAGEATLNLPKLQRFAQMLSVVCSWDGCEGWAEEWRHFQHCKLHFPVPCLSSEHSPAQEWGRNGNPELARCPVCVLSWPKCGQALLSLALLLLFVPDVKYWFLEWIPDQPGKQHWGQTEGISLLISVSFIAECMDVKMHLICCRVKAPHCLSLHSEEQISKGKTHYWIPGQSRELGWLLSLASRLPAQIQLCP